VYFLLIYCSEVHAVRGKPCLRHEAQSSAAEVGHLHESQESVTSIPESVPCEDNVGK